MNEAPWRQYRRNLPHWRMDGAVYFVTWRLLNGLPELTMEERLLVAKTLLHFHGDQYDLYAYVVMNDHVHALLSPRDHRRLEDVTRSRKSFTAYTLQRQFSRKGAIWLHESFDRIVRDDADLEEKTRYILNNPFKRWPELTRYDAVGCWGDGY